MSKRKSKPKPKPKPTKTPKILSAKKPYRDAKGRFAKRPMPKPKAKKKSKPKPEPRSPRKPPSRTKPKPPHAIARKKTQSRTKRSVPKGKAVTPTGRGFAALSKRLSKGLNRRTIYSLNLSVSYHDKDGNKKTVTETGIGITPVIASLPPKVRQEVIATRIRQRAYNIVQNENNMEGSPDYGLRVSAKGRAEFRKKLREMKSKRGVKITAEIVVSYKGE